MKSLQTRINKSLCNSCSCKATNRSDRYALEYNNLYSTFTNSLMRKLCTDSFEKDVDAYVITGTFARRGFEELSNPAFTAYPDNLTAVGWFRKNGFNVYNNNGDAICLSDTRISGVSDDEYDDDYDDYKEEVNELKDDILYIVSQEVKDSDFLIAFKISD